MSSINISKLENAWFDDEEEVTETRSSSVSSVAKENVKRKEEKKSHNFKFFSPEQREEFKNLKSKEDLDAFYKKYVDGRFDALKKEADKGLQITKSANPNSKEWEEGNKIFSDSTDRMIDFVFDVLSLKRK